MPARWESINVDDWLRDADGRSEPLGGKEKFWIMGPDGREYLFKFARCDPDGSNVRGEDWAEWAVHQLAELIGVPTAVALPGTVDGRRGILSRAVWHKRDQLIHGNELLARMDPTYDATKTRQNPGYTIGAVHAALADVAAPLSCDAPITSGFDAWAGYLVLDAWVAGRDRHHENWAVINRSGSLFLAPSFDHGNALGFQESEPRVVAMSTDDARLARWYQRGASPHFMGKPTLIDVAIDALRIAGDPVQTYWRSRLAQTSAGGLTDIFDQIPDGLMSEHGRRFRVKLLTVNRERIIDDR